MFAYIFDGLIKLWNTKKPLLGNSASLVQKKKKTQAMIVP